MPPSCLDCTHMATAKKLPATETVAQYAKRLGVSPELVQRWIRNGWLPEAIRLHSRMYVLPAGLPRPKQAATFDEWQDARRLDPEERKRRQRARVAAAYRRKKGGG